MGAVDTTYTFTATDTITSTKMNNIIDQTTMTTDAIIGTTLEVASGKLKVRSGGITSNEVASNILVSLPPTFNINSQVTCGNIEVGLGTATNRNSFIDLIGDTTYSDYGLRIIRNNTGPNAISELNHRGTGDLRIGTNEAASVLFYTNGSSRLYIDGVGSVTYNTANIPVPDGNAPIFGARSWGVIELSTTSRSITGAKNVSSVSRIDATHTQVTFQFPMLDSVYAVSGCARNDAALEFATYDHQTTGFKIRHSTDTAGRFVQFIVIR